MRKDKKFDCVQMKWNIQERIRKEFVGLTELEMHRREEEKVKRNPILGPFLGKVRLWQAEHAAMQH